MWWLGDKVGYNCQGREMRQDNAHTLLLLNLCDTRMPFDDGASFWWFPSGRKKEEDRSDATAPTKKNLFGIIFPRRTGSCQWSLVCEHGQNL
jgi:hypothetical protein